MIFFLHRNSNKCSHSFFINFYCDYGIFEALFTYNACISYITFFSYTASLRFLTKVFESIGGGKE